MTLQKRFALIAATGALLLNGLTPLALASTTIEISGNGSDSSNTSNVSVAHETTVVQSNNANIDNNVNAKANSGNNKAEGNTGGNTSIDTGDAKVDVKVDNTANTNVANVNCCNTGDTTVKISGNGSDSTNSVGLENSKLTEVYQDNNAKINNDIYAKAKTGDNKAKDNTGGNVSIDTGKATTKVDVANNANSNVAMVGGGHGNNDGGDVNLWITGNGSDSDNSIDLALGNAVLLAQSNKANIDNNIDAYSDSGDNEAKDNTGGNTSIDTGNAKTDVNVDNNVNFNFANVLCDCIVGDLTAKVSGNGTDSENDITAELGDTLAVYQDNCGDGESGISGNYHHGSHCGIDNNVDAGADTGDNKAKDDTSAVHGDPSIDTGDATSNVDTGTSGNANVYGVDTNVDLPEFNFDLNLSFDLHDLLGLLGLV